MTSRREVLGGLVAAGAGVPPLARAQAASMATQPFEFMSDGHRLSGFVDAPTTGKARAMLLIIPGYGKTDVAGWTSWYDLRRRFTALGITTALWDKPGCGKSEGTFDADQPVESSAREALDAIRHAREARLPGAGKIGFWGISRADWILPVAISQDPDIAFWISVSGTDGEENFPYLLESNLRIEGRTEAQIAHLVGQWKHGFAILSRGGSYTDYLAATHDLRSDPFMIYLTNGKDMDEASFRGQQSAFLSGAMPVYPVTGLQIYVPHFNDILSHVDMPVLAICGEKDRNVNWRSTLALYSRTIGQNPRARLTVRTFADGNHNIQKAATGGLREMIEMKDRQACDGYYETMEAWLRANA